MHDSLDHWQWFPTIIWAVVPSLSLLLLWHRRIRAAPALNGAIALFAMGMLAGVIAQGLEAIAQLLIHPPNLHPTPEHPPETLLLSLLLWQVGLVAPLAELLKLLALLLPIRWLIRRHGQLPAQPSTIMLATIAVALGFAAQDSLATLWYDRAALPGVLLKMPMQAIFSMAWGFTLGISFCRLRNHIDYSTQWIRRSWIAACLCHGAWNGIWLLSLLPGRWTWTIGPQWPTSTLSINWTIVRYLLLPWGLWLWWQTERMLQRSQGEVPVRLIHAATPMGIFRQTLFCWGCAILGGIAMNALLNFGNSIEQAWELRLIFDRAMAQALGQEGLGAMLLIGAALYAFHGLYQRAQRPD